MSEQAKKTKWKNVGTLRKSKKGGLYLKITEAIESGASITLRKPQDSIEALLTRGFITEEQAEERLAKIPEYIKYELLVAPPLANQEEA